MKVQICLLSLAVASGLALSSSAVAADTKAEAAAEAAAIQRAAAISRATAFVNGPAAVAARRAKADSFFANDAIVDVDGTEHVRFQRSYDGLPVIGGDFVVHSRTDKVGKISQFHKIVVFCASEVGVPHITCKGVLNQITDISCISA